MESNTWNDESRQAFLNFSMMPRRHVFFCPVGQVSTRVNGVWRRFSNYEITRFWNNFHGI